MSSTSADYWYNVFKEANPDVDDARLRQAANERAAAFGNTSTTGTGNTTTTGTSSTGATTMSTTSATPTSTETVTSNVPAWARQYATDILGFGKALTYPKFNPATGKYESGFQPYQGELVADESALQKQAYGDISRMQVAPQIGQATGFTGLAALQAQNLAQYDPLQQQQYYRSPFEPMGRGRRGMGEAGQAGGMGGGMDGGMGGGMGSLGRYMSPYMQGVVEQQKSQAIQDYARQIPGLRAASTRAGALGGTRQALMESEARRGLGEQLQNIQATGLQNAYQQATQQAMQDAQLRAQYGLAGTQLGEQSRQFGAGLGLQGLQQQLAAASQLGQLGQQQYGQQAGIIQAQLGAGGQQQALQQQRLASNYQKFIDEMQYPYKQLEFMSNLIRGIPSTDKTTSKYTPFNEMAAYSGILGSGGGAGGIFGSGR